MLFTKGTRWFGAGIAFGIDKSYKGSNPLDLNNNSSDYISVFALRTFARFYPKDNFILGPTLEWYRLHYTEYEEFKHQIIPGIDIGYSFNIRNRVMPYFIGSPQIGVSIVPNEFDNAYVNWGFALSGKFGTVIRFTDQLSMYIEPEFTLPHESDQLFSIHLGMSFSWGKNSFSLGSTLFPYKELMYFREFQ